MKPEETVVSPAEEKAEVKNGNTEGQQKKPGIEYEQLNLRPLQDIWFLPPVRDIIDEDDRGDLCEIFHNNCKMTPYSEQYVGIKTVEMVNNIALERLVSQAVKDYGGALPSIKLPQRKELKTRNANLFDVIPSRRSIRQYSDRKVTLEEIATLLTYSYGVSGKVQLAQGTIQDLRVISSGGGLYPLEIYPLVLDADGLESGIYHYNKRDHGLSLLREGLTVDELLPYLPGMIGSQIRTIGVCFAVTSIFRRTTKKYGSRGYRYICIEVGTLMGHLQLVAEALSLGSCQIAGYYDDVFNELLGLNGVDEAVLDLCAVGAKPETENGNSAPKAKMQGSDREG